MKGYLVTPQKLVCEDGKCFTIPSCDLKNTDISCRLFTPEQLGCGSNTKWFQQQGGNWLPWRNKPVLCRCRVPYKGPHEKCVWDSMVSYTSVFLNLINNAERLCLNLHFTGSRKEATAAVSPQEIQRPMSPQMCASPLVFLWGKELDLDPKSDLHQFRFYRDPELSSIRWHQRFRFWFRPTFEWIKSLGNKRTFFHSTHLLPSE